MTTAEQLAEALGGRRYGKGWMAHCPVHEDRTPSFRISEKADGSPLVHCFGGCGFREIVAALQSRGLWEDDRPISREDVLVRRQERELRKARRIVARFDDLYRCDTPLFDSDCREWDWARAILWMHGEEEHPYRKQIREALGE